MGLVGGIVLGLLNDTSATVQQARVRRGVPCAILRAMERRAVLRRVKASCDELREEVLGRRQPTLCTLCGRGLQGGLLSMQRLLADAPLPAAALRAVRAACQGLLDALVPGQPPAQVIDDARRAVWRRARQAQEELQRVVPLDDVRRMVGVVNGTVDGLLLELRDAAERLKVRARGGCMGAVRALGLGAWAQEMPRLSWAGLMACCRGRTVPGPRPHVAQCAVLCLPRLHAQGELPGPALQDSPLAPCTACFARPQGELPGPAFQDALSSVQRGLEGAGRAVDGLYAAAAEALPGPLVNATLEYLHSRTRQVKED